MKKTNLLLALILILAACGQAPRPGQTISECQATLDDLSGLLSSLEMPEYFQTEQPVKQGGEFDVMDYFTVFDHLSMKAGYRLDYVYHFDGMGGYPVLYVRSDSQPPFDAEDELPAAETRENFLDYIQPDGTPEGYFQYSVLAMTAGHFYLFWHANYNDTRIVCNKAAAMDIVSSENNGFGLKIPLEVKVRAFFLQNLEPRYIPGEASIQLQFVTFTKWGGFYLNTYSLSPSLPTTILDIQEKNLIHYDCGIMF